MSFDLLNVVWRKAYFSRSYSELPFGDIVTLPPFPCEDNKLVLSHSTAPIDVHKWSRSTGRQTHLLLKKNKS